MRHCGGVIFLTHPELRMLSATMNRVPASKQDKRHAFRQPTADGCHGW